MSDFLNQHLQSRLRTGRFYILDTGDFLENIIQIQEIPNASVLVTADVVGLCPGNSDKEDFEILQKKYEKHPNKRVPTAGIHITNEFVFKTYLFEFRSKSHKRISETVNGSKCDQSYTCYGLHRRI